jgi:hypothetical protein
MNRFDGRILFYIDKGESKTVSLWDKWGKLRTKVIYNEIK